MEWKKSLLSLHFYLVLFLNKIVVQSNMSTEEIVTLLKSAKYKTQFQEISRKVFKGERISNDEGMLLFEEADLSFLGMLANHIREKKHGLNTYFNRNFHIEPTNICIYSCKFCSYARKIGDTEGKWEYSEKEILDKIREYDGIPVTEVHLVGGVHPHRDLHYYGRIIQKIKEIRPDLHVKAFTAVELEFMIRKAKMSLKEGLLRLKEYGLDSIPGGGAEIFDEELRKEICDDKASTRQWLTIHETAHKLGIPSNATILYGHIETYAHRIDHMARLRDMQDRTGMFNTYIPLKYRKENNKMQHIGEVSRLEDLKNYAVSRIFLDNIPHLKAYWPMIGRDTTQLSLSFGVDDIDGTIDDSTKIYSMAGAEDQSPTLTTDQLVAMVKTVGKIPVERDTLYRPIKVYE